MGLCDSFHLYLDSEHNARRYPHSPVDHLESDGPRDSSVFLSFGRLDHISIPTGHSVYAWTGDVSGQFLGQSIVGDGAGLSQGNANVPSTFAHLAG